MFIALIKFICEYFPNSDYLEKREEYEKNQNYTEIGEDGTINIGEGGKNE